MEHSPIDIKMDLKCNVCNQSFLSNFALDMHASLHTSNNHSPNKCSECAKEYFSPDALAKHDLYHEGNEFECKLCKEVFSTESNLQKHSLIHKIFKAKQKLTEDSNESTLEKQETSYNCESCDRVCKSAGALNRHRQCHNEKLFGCNLCEKKFKTTYEVKLHMKSHVSIYCEECDITSSTKREHITHLKTHRFQKRLKCVLCSALFLTKNALASHLLKNRGNCKLLNCSQCTKQFSTQTCLEYHSLTHSRVKVKGVTCKTCGAKFITRKRLEFHKKKEHQEDKSFQCQVCNLGFTTSKGLEIHLKSHNIVSFSCEICQLTFDSEEDLQEHSLVHMTEKSVKCWICDQMVLESKLFKSNISLGEEGPFECLLCESCLFQTGNAQEVRS